MPNIHKDKDIIKGCFTGVEVLQVTDAATLCKIHFTNLKSDCAKSQLIENHI